MRLLPVDADETQIVEAPHKLRAAKLLTGFRGAPPADVEAVAKAVVAIGRLMQTTPGIVKIDVNPLMVHAKGQGAMALDALNRRRSVASYNRSMISAGTCEKPTATEAYPLRLGPKQRLVRPAP